MRRSIAVLGLSLALGCGSDAVTHPPATAPGAGDADVGVPRPDASPDSAAVTDGVALPDDVVAPDAADSGSDAAGDPGGSEVELPTRVTAEVDGQVIRIANGLLLLQCDASLGTWDIRRADGTLVVRQASSEARVAAGDEDVARVLRTRDAGPVGFATEEGTSPLGAYVALRLRATPAADVALLTELRVYEGAPFLTVDLALENTGDAPVRIVELLPLAVRGEDGGGLFVGADPADHVVLDNGQLRFVDFESTLHGGLAYTASNWNAAVVDRATGDGVVAGWLSMRHTATSVAVRGPLLTDVVDAETGREGFEELTLSAPFYVRKPVAPGAVFAGDRGYLDPATQDPMEALERYAERIRLNLGYALWDGPVPNGWNSWSASGGTGGYGTSIDEDLMIANLDFMADHLRDYGMAWFQLDDGWQQVTGDWVAHPVRFPHGMAWFADQVEARGLKAGLWIQPMTVSPSSQIYAEHPEWTVDGGDSLLLDPSLPEVRAHLTALAAKITGEWGYRWLKVDFAYQLLLASGFHDATMTPEEVYRAGIHAIRDGLAPGTFFVTVAAGSLSYDISHANRISLDTMPEWGGASVVGSQGFKDIARTVARRWYLHGRAQINHPDLIVFREEGKGGTPADQPNPLRPIGETIAFATVVGMSGGIVKIGDRMAIDLGEPQLDVLRRLLPSWGHSGRPIDVFERTFPEVWVLPIETAWDTWAVAGLINWGTNGSGVTIDDTTEEVRTFNVSLARLGLDPAADWVGFELWDERYLGAVDGTLRVEVAPRDAAVVAVRRVRADEVQLLATNRHVTMGATDVHTVTWDAATGVLTGRQAAVAGWEYRLWFRVPPGRAVSGATVEGAAASFEWPSAGHDDLLRVTFVRDTAADVTWRVQTTLP